MIDGMVSWLGPLLIIGGAVLLAAFTLAVRRGFEPSLRPIDGYKALPQQVARVVESGGRMHVSLGPNGLSGQDAGATLAGLAMLDVTVGAAAIADHPPLASTSDATTVWVMSDIVRHAYEEKGIADRLPAQNGFLVALDSTALAGGLTSLVPDMDVQANVLFGSFGAETALIAGRAAVGPQTVGSDQLEAQAAGYTLADHVLIGEEMFAARGYLEERASAQGGLLVQDVLRWAIIGLIVAGAALQTLGLLG